MDRLHQLADQLRVTVMHGDPGPGRLGAYWHQMRLIVLRPGMRHRQERVVLAHELGHAVAGDEPTGHPHFDVRQERAADMFAAALLIDPAEVERAEILHGPHPAAIATELDITPKLLAIWRDHYQRISA